MLMKSRNIQVKLLLKQSCHYIKAQVVKADLLLELLRMKAINVKITNEGRKVTVTVAQNAKISKISSSEIQKKVQVCTPQSLSLPAGGAVGGAVGGFLIRILLGCSSSIVPPDSLQCRYPRLLYLHSAA